MLTSIALVLDAGLLILIWLVQLIIYPSFQYFDHQKLQIWHPKYTRLVTFFAFPLMTGQLALHGFQAWQTFNLLNGLMLFSIALGWIITFGKEVPYHNKISEGVNIEQNIEQLIAWNWSRVVVWTLVPILQLYYLQQSMS